MTLTAALAMSFCVSRAMRRVKLSLKSHASIAPFSDSVYNRFLELSTVILTIASISLN